MVLTNEEVFELAKKNGIDIQPETMKGNESGLDYYVVTAEDVSGTRWILRIPRRNDSMQESAKEKKVLDSIKDKLPIQVPDWQIYTPELIAYPLLKGVPAGTVDEEKQGYIFELDEKNVPKTFIQTLSEALVALHNIDAAEAKVLGLEVESAEEIRISMKKRMDKVKATYGVSKELWNRWQNWIEEDSFWPVKTGLVHGDLHPGHILIDQSGSVTAVIDWTEAKFDDPSKDFISHYMVFGEESLLELIDTYADLGGYTWPKMKEHIDEIVASNAIAVAEFAQKSNLEEYHQMAREMLGVSKR